MNTKKNFIRVLIFGFLTTVLIHSCKVGPNFEKSEVPAQATFRYDSLMTDTVVNLQWWNLFNNSELDSLIYIGLNENKDVLTAASRVQQAMITVGFTKVDLYPQFGVTANANLGNVLGNNPLGSDKGVYIFIPPG